MESTPPIPDDSVIETEGGFVTRDTKGAPAGKSIAPNWQLCLPQNVGVFMDGAQKYITIPQATESELIKHLDIAARDALSKGLTSIHDAGFKPISLAFFKRYVGQKFFIL